MMLSEKFTIPNQVMARTVGDETVILDLASGTYFGLDPVGARVWQLIGEGKELAEICETMLEEYEVATERLQADVMRLAAELAERNLIVKT